MSVTYESAKDRSEGATVPVAVVTSRTEAELIVGLLHNNDLRAAVSADDAGGLEPQLQMHGVRVLVAPSDEARARPRPPSRRRHLTQTARALF